MSTRQQVGAYVYRQELARGRRAVATVRGCLRRLLEERPGPAQTAMCLAQAGLALGEADAALTALGAIGEAAMRVRCNRR